jgi:hypothetical protein
MHIRTAAVEGPLAFQMRRAAAAQSQECGLQILDMAQLAARLAGGFTTPITTEHLDAVIQSALDQGALSNSNECGNYLA